MDRGAPPTQDHIGKDCFAHPVAASDRLNTVMSRAAGPLGIESPFRPAHVEPVLEQELQSIEATDMRRVDLGFGIQDPERGQTLEVVHVEVQGRRQSSMPMQQLLVHTGRNAWSPHRPVVAAHTRLGDLWDTSHAISEPTGRQRADPARRPISTNARRCRYSADGRGAVLVA